MSRLPVIVGFGGYNAAGRSSAHHGFRRTVIESMSAADRQETLASLAILMKLVTFSAGQYHDHDGQPLNLAALEQRFTDLHHSLLRNTPQLAAEAIRKVIYD